MRVRLGQVAVVLVSIVALVAVHQVWTAATEMWTALEGVAAAPPRRPETLDGGEVAEPGESQAAGAVRTLQAADRPRFDPSAAIEVAREPARNEPSRQSSGALREARARWRASLTEEELAAHRARRREQRQARSLDERAVRQEVRERRLEERSLLPSVREEGRSGEVPGGADSD